MTPSDSEKNALRSGTLYLVGTPIGNLDDMTFRALKILREADLIAAEDTRQTLKLLTHFDIRPKRLVSCFEHNEVRRVEEILEVLEKGTVALATDAGMPGISDPGSRLVRAVLDKGFSVVPIPGPSAVLTALVASGLPTARFTFMGFLPSKASDRRDALLQMRSEEGTLIFFESPRRLCECLKDMMDAFGNRKGVVARELTKLHEEFVRGDLQELWKHFGSREALGEITLVVEGAEHRDQPQQADWAGLSIAEQLTRMMREEGLSKTDAVKTVCRLRGLPRDVVYKIATQLPAKNEDPEKDI